MIEGAYPPARGRHNMNLSRLHSDWQGLQKPDGRSLTSGEERCREEAGDENCERPGNNGLEEKRPVCPVRNALAHAHADLGAKYA